MVRLTMERSMQRQDVLGRMYNALTQRPPGIMFSKVFLVASPIMQVVISVVYLNGHPQQTYIPVYMIVAGVFGLLLGLLSCLSCARSDENGVNYLLIHVCSVWSSLVSLFLFCWLIAGSMWISSFYPANHNKTRTGELYCNGTMNMCAFLAATLVYILLAGLVVGGFSVFTCVWRFREENAKRLREEA